MAVNGPSTIFDVAAGGMLRLRGNLAAGAVLANGSIYRERLRMPVSSVAADVRINALVGGGTPTVQLVPQTANIQTNDLTISDATSGLAPATGLVNGQEVDHSYVPKGEMFVDVVVDCTPPAAACTLQYVDVGVRLR